MQERKGAEIILDHLIAEGVPYLVGLCGHGDVGLLDCALDRHDRLRTISTHNEQVAGFIADGYFRVARKPLATFTSCGPGSVNIQMPIAGAFCDSSAMLAITGNVPTQQFNRGPFQELGQHFQADFVTAMRPYVKRSFQATRADMLPDMMRHAWTTMLTGRTGPVHLDVPFNVFQETAASPATKPQPSRLPARPQADPDAIERALDLLIKAERPLILAGHGCILADAHAELRRLAELLTVPVATTPQGKGSIDEQHPLSLGPTGRDGVYAGNRAARACDVLLALGTRFGDRGASAWIPGVTHSIPPTRLIHVDLEPAQIGRNYPAEVGLVGDAKLVARQLIAALERRGAPRPRCEAWIASTRRWKTEWETALGETRGSDATPLHGDRVIAELLRVTPSNAIIVSDIGAHHSWVVQQWKVPESGLLLQSGGFATMGFGVAGSLGAQLAAPDRPVIAVVGDGGFLMHASAVATAAEYDLPVVWVVWNNCGYVSIRDIQFGFFGAGREIASRFRSARTGELMSADFAMMARAMGANGVRVTRPAELGEQVAAALASRRPTVIDVPVQADLRRRTAGGWDMLPLKGAAPNYDPDPHHEPVGQLPAG